MPEFEEAIEEIDRQDLLILENMERKLEDLEKELILSIQESQERGIIALTSLITLYLICDTIGRHLRMPRPLSEIMSIKYSNEAIMVLNNIEKNHKKAHAIEKIGMLGALIPTKYLFISIYNLNDIYNHINVLKDEIRQKRPETQTPKPRKKQ